MIQLLKNNEINRIKWDECIDSALNSMCYAYSWYLDIVCDTWDALIYDDYVAVMPLPIKSKLGLKVLMQPPFTQQLGVFSSQSITSKLLESFITAIPYLNYNLNLNESNKYKGSTVLPNYLLKLTEDYNTLKKHYHTNTRRNLTKCNNIRIFEDISIEEFIALCSKQSFWNNKCTQIAQNIIQKSIEHMHGRLLGVRNSKGALEAAVSLLITKNRITYHIATASLDGKKDLALFALVDFIIKEYADQDVILDFEGSKIDGIARFYASFNALEYSYYNVQKGFLTSIYNHIRQ